MNNFNRLNVTGIMLFVCLALITGSVDGRTEGSEYRQCQSGWAHAMADDAFGLADSSKSCWHSGEARKAISMYLLALLRMETDGVLSSPDFESDPKFGHLREHLLLLEEALAYHMRDHAGTLAQALDFLADVEPELPLIYMPRLALSDGTDHYWEEFKFQRAALLASKQLPARLALHPDWHTLVDDIEKEAERVDADDLVSWTNNERLVELQRDIYLVWNQVSREIATQSTIDDLQVIVRSYGIYRPDGAPEVSEGEGIAHGLFLDFDDYFHLETTERIPVNYGKSYGLKVEVAGVPLFRPIQLEWSMHHNPLPGADGQPITTSRNQFTRQSFDETIAAGQFLTFVEGIPIACGPWTIELLHEGQSLASQHFHVHGCD